jgi:hypothetical protein
MFYYYSNKKIHFKTKHFHFSIKHSQILYHINHFLFYNTQIVHNTITYQTSPKQGLQRNQYSDQISTCRTTDWAWRLLLLNILTQHSYTKHMTLNPSKKKKHDSEKQNALNDAQDFCIFWDAAVTHFKCWHYSHIVILMAMPKHPSNSNAHLLHISDSPPRHPHGH